MPKSTRKPMPRHHISMLIPQSEWLLREAQRLGTSPSEVIRRVLQEHIDRESRKVPRDRPRKTGAVSKRQLGMFQDISA